MPTWQALIAKIHPQVADVVFLSSNMMISGLVELILTLIIAVPAFAIVHRTGYLRSFAALTLSSVIVVIVAAMLSGTA